MSATDPSNPPVAPLLEQRVLPGFATVDWLPLMALFVTAAFWLALSSVFGLIASIKFHSPAFLADISWLTYGRVRAAHQNLALYGFCVPGGLGVALWILMRAGRTGLALPAFAMLGALLLNIGVLAGLGGMLSGDLTGYEGFELPSYAAAFVFLGHALAGVSAVLTVHSRRNLEMAVPQWYLLAAVFWFAWIYSSAGLLLLAAPVRGVAQSVIAWWFSANMQFVWLGLVGLGAGFHLLPRSIERELNSRNLALFAFWVLVLFGSWTGVPVTAPVPAWLPALSTAATALTLVLYIAVFLASQATARGRCRESWRGTAGFASFGLSAFLGVGVLTLLPVVFGRSDWLTFTWLASARWQLLVYGFFSMVMFGCIYAATREFQGQGSALPRMGRIQFWVAVVGTLFLVLPLAGAGIVHGIKLADPAVAPVAMTKATLHFLRLSTIGDTLILLANVILLGYLLSVLFAFGKQRGREALVVIKGGVTR